MMENRALICIWLAFCKHLTQITVGRYWKYEIYMWVVPITNKVCITVSDFSGNKSRKFICNIPHKSWFTNEKWIANVQ